MSETRADAGADAAAAAAGGGRSSHAEHLHVIGVDLGGTKLAVSALTGRSCSEPLIQPTEKSSSGALLDQIVAMVQEARQTLIGDAKLDAVGLGVPSVIEFATGRVISSVNIPLRDVPLRRELSGRLGGVPVFVDNDATVAAYAEAHDESLRLSARNLVMLTIGTGVGGGIVIGGRIYRGASGGAGEIGHTLIALPDTGELPAPLEQFPQPPSLEYAAAGHALDRLAQECARTAAGSALARAVADKGTVTGVDAVVAARAGDPQAAAVVELWAERIGAGVANAINTFDPEEVVIGGGAAAAGELLLVPAERVARSYVLPGLGTHTTIRLARHGAGAGVLGAALLARHELEGTE